MPKLDKKTLLTFLVIMMAGCGGPTPMNDKEKSSCVAICDNSLNNCVHVLGEDSKLECHKTYNSVCMPNCTIKR